MSYIVNLSLSEALEYAKYGSLVRTSNDSGSGGGNGKVSKAYAWGGVSIEDLEVPERLQDLLTMCDPNKSFVKFVIFYHDSAFADLGNFDIPVKWYGRLFVVAGNGWNGSKPNGVVAIRGIDAEANLRELLATGEDVRYFGSDVLAVPGLKVSLFDDWRSEGFLGFPKATARYRGIFPVSSHSLDELVEEFGFSLDGFTVIKVSAPKLRSMGGSKTTSERKVRLKEGVVKEKIPSKAEKKKNLFNSLFAQEVSF